MWFIPIFIIGALYAYAFYPGLVSPDALFQYAQMKSGQLSNLHPPLMAWLWRGTDQMIEGPGGLYVLYMSIYLLACASIVRNLFAGWYKRMSAFGMMMLPPVTAVLMSLWKDSLMIALLMMAVAAIFTLQRMQQWRWFVFGLVALWLAAMLRHNALPALLPLVFLLFYHAPQVKVCHWCNVAKTLVILALMAATSPMLESRANVTRISMLPTVAVWDMAAVSVAEKQVLLPAYTMGWQGINVDRLSQLFSPVSNVPLCQFTPGVGREVLCMEKIPLRRGRGLLPEDAAKLQDDWLNMISTHTDSYLAHRMNLFSHLLGIEHQPDFMGFNVASTQPSALSGIWYEGPSAETLGIKPFDAISTRGKFIAGGLQLLQLHTPILRPWPYVLILLFTTVCFLFTQSQNPVRETAIGLCLSGWLMLLPLFFIAPNAQLRYAIWPILCAILTMLMMRREGSSKKKKAKLNLNSD